MLLLAAKWYHVIYAFIFAFLALFLMMVILLQRGRGVGLAGAFGGGGAHTAFGSKTGDVLTWTTIVLAGIFLVYAVSLNYAFQPLGGPVLAPPANIQPVQPAPADGSAPPGAGTPTNQ